MLIPIVVMPLGLWLLHRFNYGTWRGFWHEEVLLDTGPMTDEEMRKYKELIESKKQKILHNLKKAARIKNPTIQQGMIFKNSGG